MATVGNTSTTFTNWIHDTNHSGAMWNQMGSPFTMPANGVITDINVCCGADQGQSACNAQLVVWNQSTGAVIVASSVFSMAAHAQSTTGWTFTTQSVTPTFVASGTVIIIGVYRVPSGTLLVPVNSGSGHQDAISNTGSSPGSMSGYTVDWAAQAGNMGAYCTYQPAVIYICNGSSWVPFEVDVADGTTWNTAQGDLVADGTTWNQAS